LHVSCCYISFVFLALISAALERGDFARRGDLPRRRFAADIARKTSRLSRHEPPPSRGSQPIA
jgi:hypothetical protein